MPSLVLVFGVCLLTFVLYRLSTIGTREKFLPPGPPTIPLLGNIHIFPKFLAYFQFSKWARQYGDIYSLKIGSGTIVVISSAQAIREILDKQSAVTADRPPNHFADLVTSGGLNLFLARYDGKWRALRRGAHEILTVKAAMDHRPIQDAESMQLMYDILTCPKDFFDSVRRFSASVILSVTFGKRAPRFTTKEVKAFFNVQHLWEHLLFPGSHPPVDFIPILKKVPERFAKWKTACKVVRNLQRDLYFGLLEELEKREEENGCYMETVCKRADDWGLDREMVGYLGGALIEGGSDTTSSFIQTLILALVAFPDAQRKAQEELDRVVGSDRAPIYGDLDELPYIRAVMNEVHRFRPNAPLIPRAATADVTYRGHTIPAGATIIANMWGIFHDPDVYDDPERFNPDRFIESEFGTKKERENDPGRRNNLAFGSGRRICAGIHVANYSTSVNTMNLLWAFNFSPLRNAKGEEIKPDIWNYAQALASSPNHFDCTITPRSPERAHLIRKRLVEFTPLFQAYERGISDEDRGFLEKMREREQMMLRK